MVSLRRTSDGRSRLRRPLGALLVALIALILGASPAAADPPPAPPPAPTNATDAQAQLDEVQREAEALTEQWHASQDSLAARQQDITKMQAAVGPAQAIAADAKADEENYRKQVDVVTMATFESGNLDQLDAILAARSPQDFLDQMSALETISSEYKDVLDTLTSKVGDADRAQSAAAAAVGRAQAAADQANRAEQDLAARKRDAEIRIAQAEQMLRSLSPAERRARNGPFIFAPTIAGAGIGVAALRAAASQLGKPYVWGAEGPRSYDCSGLTSYAFSQAGVTLPRSSSQQALVGTPVSWNNLQPGDLVFYYHPVSHVGIYAGNGLFINAPESGDVVRYQPLSAANFSGARRL
ncbi:MAG: C40 family peptidase [Pseudonocardiales bacterium]|nr:C40 family peptidase [Pseudonocardiales bacterium]